MSPTKPAVPPNPPMEVDCPVTPALRVRLATLTLPEVQLILSQFGADQKFAVHVVTALVPPETAFRAAPDVELAAGLGVSHSKAALSKQGNWTDPLYLPLGSAGTGEREALVSLTVSPTRGGND